jgi:hypothetical protein
MEKAIMEKQLKDIEKIILEIREEGIMAGQWEYYEEAGWFVDAAGVDWTKLKKAREAFSKIRQILNIH